MRASIAIAGPIAHVKKKETVDDRMKETGTIMNHAIQTLQGKNVAAIERAVHASNEIDLLIDLDDRTSAPHAAMRKPTVEMDTNEQKTPVNGHEVHGLAEIPPETIVKNGPTKTTTVSVTCTELGDNRNAGCMTCTRHTIPGAMSIAASDVRTATRWMKISCNPAGCSVR